MKTYMLILGAPVLMSAALSLTSCSLISQPPPPVGSARYYYTKGVPGGTIVQTTKITGTVSAIDPVKHSTSILASDGRTYIIKVGSKVHNFDQVHLGNHITATVAQKLVESVDKQGAHVPAPKSTLPAGVVAESTLVTGRIIAIDSEKRTVTIRFEDGSDQTFPNREDLDQSRVAVGLEVSYLVTELIAIEIEKLP